MVVISLSEFVMNMLKLQFHIHVWCLLVVGSVLVDAQNDGRYRTPTTTLRPRYFTLGGNNPASNDGRYRPRNDGRYVPGNDGKYVSSNAGKYSGNDGRYVPSDAGNYLGGDGKYIHTDNPYKNINNPYFDNSGQYKPDTNKGQRIGNRGQGLGNRGQGLGNRGQGLGSRGQGLGSRGQGLDSRGQGLGNRGQGVGIGRQNTFSAGAEASDLLPNLPRGSGTAEGRNDFKILYLYDKEEKDGYHYIFETENGILAEERGRIEQLPLGEGLRSKGYFEYTGDDGLLYRVDYVADDAGFVPQGLHLPKTPPHVIKLLKYLEENKKR